jgi:hypothetical protein
MNLKDNKIKLFLVVALVIIICAITFLMVNRGTPTSKINDAGGPPVSGLIDQDNSLLNVTTPSDFIAIQKRVMDYLTLQKANPSLKVVISDVEPPIRDGNILKFNITVAEINQKNVGVEIDYTADPAPTFSIPSKNFTLPLVGEEN